jgi:hypothetical protein
MKFQDPPKVKLLKAILADLSVQKRVELGGAVRPRFGLTTSPKTGVPIPFYRKEVDFVEWDRIDRLFAPRVQRVLRLIRQAYEVGP